MQATWNGRVIAASERAISEGGYVYFPRADVRMELLTVAAKTAHDLECPHGVQFYDLTDSGQSSARAAWSYERPREKMQHVDHWIGFWGDVSVT